MADEQVLKGKRVAVVGFAKSATDVATLAADVAAESHLLYRKAQWKVPRYFGNLINMRYLLFSRFSEAFFNAPRKTAFQKFLHTAGKPMVWMQWRGLELLLKKQFSLKACNMLPSHRIEDQISCSLGVAPTGFYDKVKSGAIRAQQTEIERIEGDTIHLKTVNPCRQTYSFAVRASGKPSISWTNNTAGTSSARRDTSSCSATSFTPTYQTWDS